MALLFSKVWDTVRVGVARGACDRSQPPRGTCTLPAVFHNLRHCRQLSPQALRLPWATTANFGLMKSWVQVVTSKSVVSWLQLILLIFGFSSRDKKASHRLALKSSREGTTEDIWNTTGQSSPMVPLPSFLTQAQTQRGVKHSKGPSVHLRKALRRFEFLTGLGILLTF